MSTSSFFTNETVTLEKQINSDKKITRTKLENIDFQYEIEKCAKWIQVNNFEKVCLQFPDHMLPDSSEVCLKIQNIIGQTVYVLGDTAYESCCIDYIAAAHIKADAIIHFGPICLSQTLTSLPYLNIFEKHTLDIDKFKTDVIKINASNAISIVLDTDYLYQIDDFKTAFNGHDVSISEIRDENDYQNRIIIFVATDKRKLRNFAFTINATEIYLYQDGLVKYNIETQVLKKRNYLVEKIKDSKTIGVIIGTLSIKNYSKVIERIKKLIELNNKKYYLISVGKPTVTKLANFPEVDIYVAITCSMSEIYESRDFYKPIVTPYDIEVALNSKYETNLTFSYDFNNFVEHSEMCGQHAGSTDVSLISNAVRSYGEENLPENIKSNSQIAIKSDGTIASSSDFGAGYLSARTWKGLEPKLGKNEPEIAEEGQRGLAQKYKNELSL